MNQLELRPALRRLPLGIGALAIFLAIMMFALRAAGTVGASWDMRLAATLTPSIWRFALPLMCVLMIILPWLLLDREGRRQIGIQRPRNALHYLSAIGFGALAAGLCFLLGVLLFGVGPQHWFSSVATSYRLQAPAGLGLLPLFLMFTIPAMLFSPIGEELFFRGFLQRVLEQRFSQTVSTHIESGLFALVHLCHHGVLVGAAGLSLMAASGAIWVSLMFGLAWGFAMLRQRADSIYPAMLAHAVFNVGMNACIFAYLWN